MAKIRVITRNSSIVPVVEIAKPPVNKVVFWTVGDSQERIDSKKIAINKAKAIIAKQSGYPIVYVYEFEETQLTEEMRSKKGMTSCEFHLNDCIVIQKEREL